MDTIRRSFKPAFEFTIYLVKTSWYWLLFFHILTFTFSEFFRELPKINPLDSNLAILCAIGSLATILLYSLFLILIIPMRWEELRKQIPTRSLGWIIHRYTKPLVLENLRAFVKILVWMLLLIIPGLYQYYRLTFVSWTVMLNPEYDKGRLDALKHSHDLIRGHDLAIIILLVVLATLDSSFEILGMIPGIPDTLPVKFTLSLLTLPLRLYSYSLLAEVYGVLEQKLLNRQNSSLNAN